MALFDAAARIYGVSPDEIARAKFEPWVRPHARLVRDFLMEYYPAKACRAAGYMHYPFAPVAAICPIRPPSPDLPVAESGNGWKPRQPALPAELLAAYVWPIRETSLWDADSYRLLAFDPVGSRATFAVDRFLLFRLTTALMREELHYALSRGASSLPLREQLAPHAEALVDLHSHRVFGGVHTLCAFARPAPHNDFLIPLQRRSARVGVAGGSLGVIPMAFHQPCASGALDPRAPATTALREIFEELFGGVETQEEAKFLTHPAIEWLLNHRDDLHFQTTNFFFSLFGGNFDFSLLLAVTNTDFWQRFGPVLETTWESEEHFLLSTLDRASFGGILREPDWEAQALGCCLDGLRRLQSIDPARMLREPYDVTAS